MSIYRDVITKAAVRDDFRCLRCGRPGQDVAHILPKGRYPELKFTLQNLVTLCRKCHVETETVEGRRELLELMKDLYEYDYSDERYQSYLRGDDG